MKRKTDYESPEVLTFIFDGDLCSISNPGAETSVDNYSEENYNWE